MVPPMPDNTLPYASLHPTEFKGRFAVHVGDAYAGTLKQWGTDHWEVLDLVCPDGSLEHPSTVHTSGEAAVEALLRSWLDLREGN